MLGAAAIVPAALTKPVHSIPEVQVLAIAARDPKRAQAFARKHHIRRVDGLWLLPRQLDPLSAEAEPIVACAEARLFAPQVDHKMSADLSFADGRTAHLVCDMLSPKLFCSFLRVKGDGGALRVINPYHPHWFNWLSVRGRNGSQSGYIRAQNAYALQLRAFIQAIRGETKLNTDPVDAIGNMRLIDAIYGKAGFKRRGT